MKSFIYVRASNQDLKDYLVNQCKEFCFSNGLDIKSIYFDIGIVPSTPKGRWEGFLSLLEEIQVDECIVCQRVKDLPPFFLNEPLTVPIRFMGDKEFYESMILKEQEINQTQFGFSNAKSDLELSQKYLNALKLLKSAGLC